MRDTNCSDRFFCFMPGCGNEYMPDKYIGELFHYTSPNGFLSILNGKSDKAFLWVSPFVCSFSKNRDPIAMWKYYSKGSQYEGFNIGFHILHQVTFLESKLTMNPIQLEYDPKTYNKRSMVGDDLIILRFLI